MHKILSATLAILLGIIFLNNAAYAQYISINDPFENYLRMIDIDHDRFSSYHIRPVRLEKKLFQEIGNHPWQEHLFFQRNLKSPSIDRDTVSTRIDNIIHFVQEGETLYRISRRYGVPIGEIMQWNGLINYSIYPDQLLFIYREPQGESRALSPKSSVEENRWNSLPETTLYNPTVTTTYNDFIPWGQNDGSLWQGKGFNTFSSFGAIFEYGPIEASIRPELIYVQNQDFKMSKWPVPDGVSKFGYEFSLIDYPQRFGDTAFSKFYPGQSWVKVKHREFEAGVSTANIWIGPAVKNPLLFSNNAPGFFHVFLGTNEPYETQIGEFEGKLLWGRLKESQYFDEDPSNDSRFIHSLILNYNPSYLKGLDIGLARVFVRPYAGEGISFSDYFLAFQRGKRGSPSEIDRIQMLSLFWRWKIPGYGFEFYGEWVRNTSSDDFRDLLLEPEYSRAYTLGFIKKFSLPGNRWLRLNYEMTQLERPRLVEFRDSEPIYLSEGVIQGYTNRGQILGAGIGPGSNNQSVQLEFYDHWGSVGASFARVVHDITRLYKNYEVIGERPRFIFNPRELSEVELRFGLHSTLFLFRNLEMQIKVYRSQIFHFRHRYYRFPGNEDVFNTNAQLTLRYSFGSHR